MEIAWPLVCRCMYVVSRRRPAGAIRSVVNARDLQLEFTRVLHEALLVSVLMSGSEVMLWREKNKSRVRVVQMDNLRGLRNEEESI